MVSTAQQVDDTCLKLNNKTYIFLSSKMLSNSIMFHQFNKFCKSKLPNFTAKLTIIWEKNFVISSDNITM